ncbi:MAG: triose-phosphate isomerase family protein [Candidatus Babeliales bacterium]
MKQLLIANWKMYLSFEQSVALATQCATVFKNHADALSLVICPSFESIAAVVQAVKGSGIAIGAQNCAPALRGPYTGQVSALNVAELGCAYCIIGHTEQRTLYADFETVLRSQLTCVLDARLTPIVCIGETAQERHATKAIVERVIRAQLQSIANVVRAHTQSTSLCIAYEPAWAIGAAQMPEPSTLNERIQLIRELIAQELPQGIQARLLYGGAVDAHSGTLSSYPVLDGFLVGRATTDFQSFQKIVLSMHRFCE